MRRRSRGFFGRFSLTFAVAAALSLTPSASPARAAVTIGQVGPPVEGPCEGFDALQETVSLGNSYTVPGAGTITQWSTYGNSSPGPPQLKLKIYRLIAPPATYQVVGHAGPQSVTGTGTAGNTFPANIRVQAGDLLGVNGTSWCILASDGGRQVQYMGDLADGASAAFTNPALRRLNVQATFIPDNTFQLARTTRNKKKGTATLSFNLPNSGDLSGSGNGAKVASAGAHSSKSVPAGLATLLVRAKGKKKRKLNETGKVKLNVAVTYTPTGGDPNTQSRKLKLKKRL
jgi:hypothetical protein